MAISPDLLMAILAMDSYNRGYNAGVVIDGTRIGSATLGIAKSDPEAQAASFFAQAYQLSNGNTVISYRGTDVLPYVTDPLWSPSSWNDVAAWSIWGRNNYDTAQARLAAQFYQQIRATGAGAGENAIITTGHSLGGALAGFIAGIYGLPARIFDNIGFMDAASKLYTAVTAAQPNLEARDFFFGGQTPAAPFTFPSTRVHGYQVMGEVASFTRSGDESALLQNIGLGLNTGLNSIQLHSQALLVIGLYAQEQVSQSDWMQINRPLLAALFSDQIGNALGFTKGQTGTSDAGRQMQTAIAYSAIDEGTRVFGDTGIRALFDDANELGRVVAAPLVANYLTAQTVQRALSDIIVQYAGLLAKNKDVTEVGPNQHTGHQKGALYHDQAAKLLLGDFDPDLWRVDGQAVEIFGRKTLIDALTQVNAPSSYTEGAAKLWAGQSDHLIKMLATTSNQGATINAGTESGIPSNEPVNGRGGLLVGGDGQDTLVGAQGRDLLFGGSEIDTLVGGKGDDLMFGGAGRDTFTGYGEAAAAPSHDPDARGFEGNDWIDGGADRDTADYSRATSPVTVSLGVHNGFVRSENVVLLTNDGTGGRDTLVSVETVKLGSAKDVIEVRPFGGESFRTDRTATLFDMGGEPESAKQNLLAGDWVDFSQFDKPIYIRNARSAIVRMRKGAVAGLIACAAALFSVSAAMAEMNAVPRSERKVSALVTLVFDRTTFQIEREFLKLTMGLRRYGVRDWTSVLEYRMTPGEYLGITLRSLPSDNSCHQYAIVGLSNHSMPPDVNDGAPRYPSKHAGVARVAPNSFRASSEYVTTDSDLVDVRGDPIPISDITKTKGARMFIQMYSDVTVSIVLGNGCLAEAPSFIRMIREFLNRRARTP